MTPLKFLFHHQVRGEGNINTPKVATYKNQSILSNGLFHSHVTAVYKHIIQFDSDPAKEKSQFSIDAGIGENPF